MTESNNCKTPEQLDYENLQREYEAIAEAGGFVKEFSWGDDEMPCGAAVGSADELRRRMQLEPGEEITQDLIDSLPPILLFANPGSGKTRLDAVREAKEGWLSSCNRSAEQLDLYGSFEEKGYMVQAFLPVNDAQPNQWTVIVSKDGQEIRRQTAPLSYRPIFGPDVDDVAMLEKITDELLTEL